jgi:hypothetical protein
MPADRCVVRRRYSAISPPPLRGFVLAAVTASDDHGRQWIEVEQFSIVGVATCTESRWTKHERERGEHLTEQRPLTPEELRDQGYGPDTEGTSIVPVLFTDADGGPPHEHGREEDVLPVLLPESDVAEFQTCEVVWRRWDAREDERRLAQVETRLRERHARKKKVRNDPNPYEDPAGGSSTPASR